MGGGETSFTILHRKEVNLMITISDALSLMISFGMLIIALLTFIVVLIKMHNKK
jgi:hypothetical protein